MKDPAALLYIDTWKQSTTEMDAITRAYYMDLILHQYDKGDLPNNIEELANICRVRFSEFDKFKQVFEQVLKQKFKQNENGRLENDVAKDIIQRRKRFIEKRSNAGKLSYILKYFRRNYDLNGDFENFIKENIDLDIDIKNEQVLKQVFKQISELYINGDKDIYIYNGIKKSNNISIIEDISEDSDKKEIEEELSTEGKELNIPFEEFWEMYDKKINRTVCERLWSKLKDKERVDIINYIPLYHQSQPDKVYRKHPATFLRNESWKDEIITKEPVIKYKDPHLQKLYESGDIFPEIVLEAIRFDNPLMLSGDLRRKYFPYRLLG